MSHCHACLAELDRSQLRLIDVQPSGSPDQRWRQTTLCADCTDRVGADMWISEDCLLRINCKTAFTDLPLLDTP